MPPVLDRAASRDVDRRAIEEYGLSGLVLMENAGRGAADSILQNFPDGACLICCGKGNNAGDGFVIARHLDNAGRPVRILLCADPAELRGDAETNYRILERSGAAIETLASEFDAQQLRHRCNEAELIVDALLGTGARGEPRPPFDRVIDELNASGKPIVAVDLPSGLDCDTGQAARHTIRAARTLTFVALKPGFLKPEAKTYTGEIEVLSIGAPRKLIEEIFNASRTNP